MRKPTVATSDMHLSAEPDPYVAAGVFLAEHAPSIAEAAIGRIRACEGEYGDSYVWTPLRHLLDELAEEAVDLSGWSALIADRLAREPGGTATRATALLAAIARHADEADVLVGELRQVLEIPS